MVWHFRVFLFSDHHLASSGYSFAYEKIVRRLDKFQQQLTVEYAAFHIVANHPCSNEPACKLLLSRPEVAIHSSGEGVKSVQPAYAQRPAWRGKRGQIIGFLSKFLASNSVYMGIRNVLDCREFVNVLRNTHTKSQEIVKTKFDHSCD